MKNTIAIFGLLGALIGTPNTVLARPVECLLEVNGRAYIKGVCEFSSAKGGNFQISGNNYFATLTVYDETYGREYASKNIGGVFWNADPLSTHAQAPLGEVHRKGPCWESPTVKICARGLSPAKVAEIEAPRPKGKMIELVAPGYPRVYPRGYDFKPGTELVLGYESGPLSVGEYPMLFKTSTDNIVIDKHPDLCIDAKPTTQASISKLVLEDCSRISIKWKRVKEDETIRSSSSNLCWRAGGEDQAGPIPLTAAPCHKEENENHHFWFN